MNDFKSDEKLEGVEDTPDKFENILEQNGIPASAASLFKDEVLATDTPTPEVTVPPVVVNTEIPKVDTPDNNDNSDDNSDDNGTKVSIFEIFNEDYKTDFKPDENKDIVTQLKDFVNYLLDNTKKSEKEATIEELKANPMVKHILEGYSEEVVNYESNYQTISAINLEDATVEVKSDLYKQSLISKGIDEEEADEMVNTAIANDTIDAKADKAKTTLETYFKSQVDAQKQLEDTKKQSDAENYNKIVNEVSETVKKGFNGIILPEKDINDLIEYTTKVDPKTGLSKADENFYALSNEDKLTIDYIIKKGLLKTVATNLNSPEKVNKLKEAIELNSKRPVVRNSSDKREELMDLAELKRKLGA